MRNTLLLCLTAVFFVLQLYVFLMPAYAGTCTAECGGGASVSCTGYSCFQEDGVGCWAWDRNENLVAVGKCQQPKPE
jgi:hypothetical protein